MPRRTRTDPQATPKATETSAGTVVLLGPQRAAPILDTVCDELGLDGKHGPLALVTAGWEEREAEDEPVRAFLEVPLENLALHQRAARVFDEDPELFAALRRRHDRMRRLRTIYRRRLDHAMAAWRDVLRPPGHGPEDEFVALERLDAGELPLVGEVLEEAFAALRDLDTLHLKHVSTLQAEFAEEQSPAERPAVAREREQIAEVLGRCTGLLVAGGHVAVLLNRLRLFGVAGLLDGLPVIGWSAGAMALTQRIVLFHDRPPQGQGAAEVFEPGLGLARGVVALPDATKRLDLDDPLRVVALARRQQPLACLPLDAGERATCVDGEWTYRRQLGTDGTVVAT
jgi:hypothetical protein